MSEKMDSATLPLQPALWSKKGLRSYCSLLREPLLCAGLHVIELCNPAMTEKRRGQHSFAIHNINNFALLKYNRDSERVEGTSGKQRNSDGELE